MNLSYEEFIKLLPEGTKEYVDIVLKYMDGYIVRNNDIYVKDDYNKVVYNSINNDYKIKAIFLGMFSKSSEYSYIAKKLYNSRFIGYSGADYGGISVFINDKVDTSVFDLYKEYFLIYSDSSYYYGLTPLELVNNIFNINHNVLEFDDSYYKRRRCFIDNKDYANLQIDKIIEEKRKEFENKLNIELFRNIPIDIVHLVTNASKIYNYNIKHIKSMLYKSIDDLVVDSIFTSYLSSEDEDIKNMVKKLNLSPGIIDFYRKKIYRKYWRSRF